MRHPPYVAVIGPSEPEAQLLGPARLAGVAIAARNWVLITGGLGGVMAAAAAGAASRGGAAVGLLPGDDRTAASAGHTVVIPTGLGELRNALVVRASDAVFAVGGSWGTQIEVSLAVRTGVPVVSVAGWAQPAPGVHDFDDVEAATAWLERRFTSA